MDENVKFIEGLFFRQMRDLTISTVRGTAWKARPTPVLRSVLPF